MSPAADRRRGARFPWPAVVAVVGVLALYAPTLGLSFLSDDFERIDDALSMARAGPRGFLLHTGADGYYRPVFYLSLGLDHAVWGLDPAGFHRTNLVLHLLVLLLALTLAERHLLSETPAPRLLATAAAAILAVYPHHVDAVAWISGRSGLLAALFGLGALACYLSTARWSRAAGPALLALAILSKESGFLLALLPWAAGAARQRKPLPRDTLPYLAVAIVLGLWRLSTVGATGAGRLGSPLRWPVNWTASFAWLLLPADGERLHDLGLRAPVALLAAVVLAGAGLAAWALRRRSGRALLLRGLVLAGLTLILPALVGTRARYLYVASLALVPALAGWIALRLGTRRRLGSALAALVLAGIFAGCLAGAVQRRRAWSEASRLSERFLESLAITAHGHPYQVVRVLGAPFTLRGASIAANWTKALRVAYGVKAEVRVLNTLRVPAAGWDGLRVSVPAPGVVRQRLQPGPHAAFHFPGEARGGDQVRLREATVSVVERDARGRVTALDVALDREALDPEAPLRVAVAGRLVSPWD